MSGTGEQQLGPRAERAWKDLALHIEWHPDRFWVAWVFTDDARVVRAYQQRMAALLADKERTQRIIEPATPARARVCLDAILSEDTAAAHCVWVNLVRIDVLATPESEDSWSHAWQWLMMRANEHRGRLSRHLPGGLIIAGSSAFKAGTAAAAPDLWSIRALVLEP